MLFTGFIIYCRYRRKLYKGYIKKRNGCLRGGYYFNAAAPVIKCISTPVICTTQIGQICTWTEPNNVSQIYSDM